MGTAISIIVTLFVSLLHPGKPATVQSNVQVQSQVDESISPTETPSITSAISPTDTPSVTPSVSPSVSPTGSPTPSVSPVPTGEQGKDDQTPFGWFVSEAAHVRNALRFDNHTQEKTEANENSETQTDTK